MRFILSPGHHFAVGDKGLCSKGSFLSRMTPAGMPWAEEQPRIYLVYEDRVGSSQLGNCLPGQLTDEGKASLFKLGMNLHEAYVYRARLLKPIPDPEEVHVRSTEIPRAIESAQNLLYGLFPVWASGKVGREAALEIHINEGKAEYLYPNFSACARLKREYEQFKSELKKNRKEELQAIADQTHGLFPSKSTSTSVHDVFDAFVCAEAHGVSLPPELTPDMIHKAETLLVEQWWSPFQQSETVTKLGIGMVVGELASNLKRKIDGKSKTKLHLISAHDSTIAPLLIALGQYDKKWPPFAANIVLELYESKKIEPQASSSEPVELAENHDNHFVRVMYNSRVLRLPECKEEAKEGGTLCPLGKFFEIAAKRIPKNYVQECEDK